MEDFLSFQKEKCLFFFCFKQKGIVLKTLFNLFAVLAFFTSDAQSIKWTFDGPGGTDLPSQSIANVTVSPLSQKNNYGATTMLSSSSASSGYTGASGSFNACAATISAGFNANTSTYFEFTLSPSQGYTIVISKIGFGSRSTGTGPQAYSIRTSIDSYNSDITAGAIPNDSKWNYYEHPSLSLATASSITIRIYGFNGTGSSQNTAVWRIDDLSLDVAISAVQTSYRSKKSGQWASASNWEYSTDNLNWNPSSYAPGQDVENILIANGHTITVDYPVSIDQVTIAGTLELQTGGSLNINDGQGDDIIISPGGVLKITSSQDYSATIKQSGNASINISANGKIQIGDGSAFTGNGYENFATSLSNIWNNGAVYEFNCSKKFEAPGLTYFPNAPSNVIPVFRVSTVSGTPGSGSSSPLYVNGILEVNCDFTFSGTGDKYLRNGIRGNYTLTKTGTGQLILNGVNPVLEGNSLKVILNNNLSLLSSANIPAGAQVTISGSSINNNLVGNIFTINGTLDVTDQGIGNKNGQIILNGLFKTKNPGGFSGSGSSIVSGSVLVNRGSTIELYSDNTQYLNARTDFSNLIFSGSGTKIPKGPFSPNGTITIKDNAIFDCTGNINGINIGDANTNLTMTGNSRLIVSTYGPNPPIDGIYNLSGGVIEFRCSGSTSQTIRSKNYQNIEVTGTNVGMSDGNIYLNKDGTFKVKSGGIFSINDNTITGSGDGSQTVTIENGGLLKCGTNMGFNGATITSIPIKSSAFNADIKKIILEPGSTIDYSRKGDQPITNADGLVYQNLVISNTGNKTAPSGDLVIEGNFSKTSEAVVLHNNGTVTFRGATTQIYSSASPQIIFNNLKIENAAGLQVNDSLSIYNELALKDYSTLYANSIITLLSRKENSASISQLGLHVNINDPQGNFIVERYINTNTTNGGHQKAWQFVSVPAFGETIFDTWQEKGSTTISGYGTWITDKTGIVNGFDATSPAPSMKYFDTNSGNFTGVSSTHTNLETSNGYMIFVRGDRLATSVNSLPTPTVLRTKGKIYCPQSLPSEVKVPAGKFQSVGNPYASAIDFSKLATSNTQSSYIAWDPTLGGEYGVGGYQTISAVTGYKAVPGNSANYNTSTDYRVIQSGQAVFVYNPTYSEGSIRFDENCKVSGNHHLVTRDAEQKNQILFANLFSSNHTVLDGNAVSFSQDYSNDIDVNDAIKFETGGSTFCVKRSGKLLSIEARKEIISSDTIFYSLGNLPKQQYTFNFIPENITPGLTTILIDNYLKTETPISLTENTDVTFTITDDKNSSVANRFYIIFRTSSPLNMLFFSMNVIQKEKAALITWKTDEEADVRNYKVEHSTDGIHFTEIGCINAGKEKANSYEFLHLHPAVGNNFYRISITKMNGEIQYHDVMKIVITGIESSIKVYPNPIQHGVIQLQFSHQSSGTHILNLFDLRGYKLFSKKVLIERGNSLQVITLRKEIANGIYNLEIIKPDGSKSILKIEK